MGILHFHRQLGKGLAKLGNPHHRVKTETVAAQALTCNLAHHPPHGDEWLRVFGRTHRHQRADHGRTAVVNSLHLLQQCGDVVVVTLGVAVLGGVVGCVHARQTTKGVDAQAGVVGQRGQAGVLRRIACLGQRVFHKGAVGLGRLGHAQVALAHQGAAQRAKHGLQFDQLALVVGCENDLHEYASSAYEYCASSYYFDSESCCKAISSPMPCSASPSSWSISARVNATPSAVPCTSTKCPAPVITTFMSVSQAESSVYSRSSSGVPCTMPKLMAATAAVIGVAVILSALSRPFTASWAATKAPVMAAVRVPPSAWITSQSSWMVRSPSFFKSNTARSERPIRRWISCVRPLCLPLAASRSLRLWVARGSMPYSAVTQPSPLPRLCGGTRSSTDAVHSTLVLPNSMKL